MNGSKRLLATASIATHELINLHWLPAKQRIDFKVLMLVYKALHGQAPPDIQNMLCVNADRRELRSSCSTLLVVPRTRCITFGDRAFSAYAPKIWNELPHHIKNSNYSTFKSLMETHLFPEGLPVTFCLQRL